MALTALPPAAPQQRTQGEPLSTHRSRRSSPRVPGNPVPLTVRKLRL